MASALEMSVDTYEDLCGDARIRKLVSLDAPVDDDNATPLSERIAGDNEDPTEKWANDEIKTRVIEAVHILPLKERTAVSLYYLNGLTLKEIGEVLGVTESRACQLRGQGIKRLKFRLRKAVH
jgi:RNA polymerase sigma factor for flagellar operon FliA